jgi:O-antigen/teichoic acid export membrane protein
MIVLLAVPAVLGVAATAPLLIPVLLGPNWTAAIPVVTLLALFGFTNLVQGNAQAAYLALGRADVPAKINSVHVTFQIAALIPLTQLYGVNGAAIAYLLTAAAMIPLSLGVVLRMLRISLLQFVARVWRPIVAAILMFVCVREYIVTGGTQLSGASALLHLVMAVGLGAIVYVGSVGALWLLCRMPPSAERVILSRFTLVTSRVLSRRGALS